MITKYYEDEFEISTQKNLKFKFKNIPTTKILSMIEDFQMYAAMHDSKIYEGYVDSILSNTTVCINEKWYPLKEKGNYYPASIETDFKGLNEIVNRFFSSVVSPVFQGSNESSTEQE